MLNDNIRNLRKSKGISQEEMAVKLNVVRQTISKWEKGLSVPDSEMLIKIADLFEVSVSVLLGNEIPIEKEDKNEISEKLQRINEQLAIKNRRTKTILKIIIWVIVSSILLSIIPYILIVFGRIIFNSMR